MNDHISERDHAEHNRVARERELNRRINARTNVLPYIDASPIDLTTIRFNRAIAQQDISAPFTDQDATELLYQAANIEEPATTVNPSDVPLTFQDLTNVQAALSPNVTQLIDTSVNLMPSDFPPYPFEPDTTTGVTMQATSEPDRSANRHSMQSESLTYALSTALDTRLEKSNNLHFTAEMLSNTRLQNFLIAIDNRPPSSSDLISTSGTSEIFQAGVESN